MVWQSLILFAVSSFPVLSTDPLQPIERWVPSTQQPVPPTTSYCLSIRLCIEKYNLPFPFDHASDAAKDHDSHIQTQGLRSETDNSPQNAVRGGLLRIVGDRTWRAPQRHLH
ncbi:hypothetical protein BXZ70DRAFT_920991, partial [Cristinia sonorae]